MKFKHYMHQGFIYGDAEQRGMRVCAISPAGGQRACMNGHLRDRWKQAMQKLIAQYREHDKKPKERKGK